MKTQERRDEQAVQIASWLPLLALALVVGVLALAAGGVGGLLGVAGLAVLVRGVVRARRRRAGARARTVAP